MKNKTLKTLSLGLAVTTAFSTSIPVFAYDVDEHGNSIESVEYQNTEDENFSNAANVFAELGSEYKVTIPKTVVLSGESKDARYYVKVAGDIAGYEQISVIPDESFNLYTKKKDPQEAFVTQDKTIWHVSDFNIDANGTIKANTITAGKWSGVFYFNINLEDGEKVAGDIIIPPDLPLDDDYRLIIEKISDAPGLYDDNFTLILPWPEIAKRIEGGETISQIVNSCPGGVYLSIPQGTSIIPTNYLPDTNIKYIYVPDTVTTIQTTSCPGSPIKGVFLPKSTKVEPGAFDNTPAGENKQVYVGGQRIVDTVININELPEREEDIKDEDALILEKGCKYQITALYNFYDDVTKQSTIKSSNPDVVKFIPDCTLEALEVGTSIISGKYFGPLGERNAYLLVKVIDTGYSKGSIPSNTHKHVVGPLQEENKVLATCTEDGHVDQVFYCSDCNKELGRRTIPIYATGHIEGEWVVVKEATENETGLKEQRCTVCGELLDSEEIPMTQHIAKAAVKENEVPATCEKDGSYDEVVYCSVCDAEISRTVVKIPALGHDYKETIVNPTHKEKGYTLHTCSRCGDTYKDNETSILAHVYDSGKITKEATCTEDGIKTYTCSCGDTKTEVIKATGHKASIAVRENEKAATCTATGSYDEVVYCSVCKSEISRTKKTIPALGHDYVATITAPTHTTKGYTTHTCSRCGDTYKDTETNVIAHTYDSGKITKTATCTTDGIKTYTCTGCDATKTEVITKLGHDYATTVIAPTCTTDGYTKHACSRCDNSYNDTTVTKLGHNYVEGTCTRCGDTLPALSVSASGFTGNYDAKAHSISVTSSGNTIQYSTDNSTWSSTNPSYTNAGTYTVYYKVNKDGYKTVTGLQKIVINKVNGSYTTEPTAKTGLTYTGSAQQLINTGTTSTGTIYYKVGTGSYSTAIPTATNVGTYTVYYKIVGNTNYNNVVEKSINVEIKSECIEVALDDNSLAQLGYSKNKKSWNNVELLKNGTVVTNLSIPETYVYNGQKYRITSIATAALQACQITSVTIPSSVTSIGDHAFYNNKLTSVVIPNSVTSIGKYTFAASSTLTSVTIPSSVTSIGDMAFWYDTSLTSINVDSANPNYSSENGALFNKDKTILICYSAGKTGSYTIPNSITSIKDQAFYCSKLTNVIIPNSVTNIGYRTFYETAITSIIIPNSVTNLAEESFYCSRNLKTITIGNSVKTIGKNAFGGTLLESVTIPSSVTSIEISAFKFIDSLKEINVDSANPNYSSENGTLFNKNKTALLLVPKRTTGTYTIPSSVKTIGDNAFYNTGYETITIPSSVTNIEKNAFSACYGLKTITIGNSVKVINDNAFSNCTKLTSITIPSSVTSIGKNAFSNCTSLKSITFANKTGWYVTTTQNATSGTNIAVTNTSTNVTNFKDKYVGYFWYRK